MQSRRPKPRALTPKVEERQPLAGGALARVERARLTRPFAGLDAGTEIVLKGLLPAASQTEREALIQEGRLGLGLRHPQLVRTLAVLPDFEGSPTIVTEWIPGCSLDELFARGPVPEPLVRRMAADVASALAALHEAGWAHNDVKPSNLRLGVEGSTVLLDLGLATRLGQKNTRHEPGSFEWMPPERQAGGPPSAAADVFSLGLVLVSGAVGKLPSRPIPHASSLAPRLSPFFDELATVALDEKPSMRPTAAQLAAIATEGEASDWWRERITSSRTAGFSLARSGSWPLIGHERELERLETLAARSFKPGAPRRPGAVLLTGPEGIGKWELVGELATRSRRATPPPLFLSIRATNLREARPLGTLLELLRHWLGLPHDAEPAAHHTATLAHLLPPKGVETLTRVLSSAEAGEVPGSVSQALFDWICALAEEGPLILFLDELQKAGPDTRRVLIRLMHAARDPKLMLLLIAGERDDLPTPPDPEIEAQAGVVLELGPVDEAAVARFVQHAFVRSAPQKRLAAILMQRSRGNPGLLAEIMRHLESSGSATPQADGKLQLLIAPEDLPLPGSLRNSIESRFRALDRPSRTLLARLAVLRGRMTPKLIRRVFPDLRRVDLTSRLAHLVRLGWLVGHGDHFRFVRPAQSEVIRGTLAKATLEHLHVEAAAGFAPRPGEHATITSVIRRAWHLREAHQHRALVEAVRAAIRALVARGQPQRVAQLAQWGIEALDQLNPDPALAAAADRELMLALLEHATAAAGRLGKREQERKLLDRLADLAVDPSGDPTRTARVYLLHGRYARDTASFGLARGLFKNAIEFARTAGRPHLQAEAETQLARVLAEVGQLEEARAVAQNALEHSGSDDGCKAAALVAMAQVEILSARPDMALKSIDRALSTGRKSMTRLPGGLKAEAHLARARIWRDLGRPQRALGSAEKALELASHAGERVLEAEASARLGGLLVVSGQEALAETQLREALLISEEVEDRRGVSLARLWLGTLLAERTDVDGASELERSAEEAGRIGLFRTQAMGLAICARVHLARSRTATASKKRRCLESAEKLSLTATALSERHGAEQRDRIVIRGTRAMLLHETGRDELAHAAVRELRREMRRANQRITDTNLRRLHRLATTRLLEAVLSPDGPVFPRS